MAKEITKKQRLEVEERIYKVMDMLDKTKTNSEYYKKEFAKMSDTQFVKVMSKKFPLKFHVNPMVIEPNIADCERALNFLGSKLMEKVTLPYFYTDKDGNSVTSQEAIVFYVHIPKVQQMIVKKNKNAIDIDNRDMKTGRLNGDDKGAVMSDREFECMATLGMTKSMDEFARFRADAMGAKSIAYSLIRNTGILSIEDVPREVDDVLSKQLMNTYLLGAHINTNLINVGNYTAYTLEDRKRKISRN